MIDPIGVGLAKLDPTGRFDPGIDIAQYGVLPALPDAKNPAFASIADLASKLQQMPDVSACLASKVFVYTQGREPERLDTCAVEGASQSFANNGQDFPALLKGLVTAPTFRLRRIASAAP
jgi:hypothetical protein